MDHDETGCQPPQNGPILCINNCGFFGSAASINMCSKCYRDMTLKQEQAKVVASSIENIVNGTSVVPEKEPAVANPLNLQANSIEVNALSLPSSQGSSSAEAGEPKAKEGPKKCSSCKKKVGLTGFMCRCGNLFCGSHRYSDKHDCQFDYRSSAQDAIAKANPLVKAEKIDKI